MKKNNILIKEDSEKLSLYIKNMVCNRCVLVVEQLLDELDIVYRLVKMGEILLQNTLSVEKYDRLSDRLSLLGFEIIDDRRNRIIEEIKRVIIEAVFSEEDANKENLSVLITDCLPYDYTYLSTLFSSVEGITIERYHILQKIERAKELLVYDELTLSQIALKLGYSSVAHLSSQFKKVTGLTASHFKRIGRDKRTPIDLI